MSEDRSPLCKRCRIVTSRKPGVWTSSSARALAGYERSLGHDVRVVQVATRPHLSEVQDGSVETIRPASTEELRENDLAELVALEPLVEAMFAHDGAIVIDLGAECSERVLVAVASMALDREAEQAGIDLAAIVPMTPTPDGVLLAIETMERVRVALPSAEIVPMLCDDPYASFAELGRAQAAFDEKVAPLAAEGKALLHPHIPPRAAAMLAQADVPLWDLADLPAAEVSKLIRGAGVVATGAVCAAAATWKWQLLAEFRRLLPEG